MVFGDRDRLSLSLPSVPERARFFLWLGLLLLSLGRYIRKVGSKFGSLPGDRPNTEQKAVVEKDCINLGHRFLVFGY